jgi:hypothetical protein
MDTAQTDLIAQSVAFMIFRRVMRHVTAVAVTLAAVVLCSAVRAQDLEPRAYSNSPTGLSFLIMGYGYATASRA